MTRILVVSNMYPPHHYGGYELACRDTMDRLADRGHQVEVLTTDLRLPDVEAPDEAHVHRVLRFYWDDHEILRPPWSIRRRWERANQRFLNERLAAFRPEVVSFWNMGAMSLGLLAGVARAGVPMLLVVYDDWLVYGPVVDGWSAGLSRLGRFGRAVADRLGAPTAPAELPPGTVAAFCAPFGRDVARREAAWTIPDDTIIRPGMDRVAFPEVEPPAEPRPWSGRLLYTGRIDERKGVPTVLDALARLPDEITLRLDGRGDPDVIGMIRQRIDREGWQDRVTMGISPRHELADRYREADAFLFPSEWDEPFGLTPIESMACATPVIGTGVGGSSSFLVDGWNHLHFPPGDAAALAAAVTRLAGDASLRQRLVVNGLATAAQLTTDRTADEMEKWHVAVATGFAAGRPPEVPLVLGDPARRGPASEPN